MAFPRKLAVGSAFCNREQERTQLASNIAKVEHIVLVSPRRYGKTSLVLKVLEENSIPFAHVDLFLALTEEKVLERFLAGISQLINHLIPINAKMLSSIKEFFKAFNLSLTVGSMSMSLKLEPPKKTPERILLEAFQGVESILKKKGKTAAFFIDEMQDIIKLPICADIEFALRSIAQESKQLAFVFSGSNRHLLKNLFDDRSRPLWKLCKRMNLTRIDTAHYQPFLNAAAKKRWKTGLSAEALGAIFAYTECHPYYMNYLCSELWERASVPNAEEVTQVWLSICDTEEANVAEMLSELKDNQKKILLYIASQHILFHPTANKLLVELKLTSRGMLQSLKGLEEKDFIEYIEFEGKTGCRVLDPLMRQVLLNRQY